MKKMPQEIEVWYVIPAIRAELSKQMLKLGLSQADIAKKLDISRAAVTQYVKNKRANDIELDENTKKKVKIAAKKCVEENASVMKEVQIILDDLKKEGCLCRFHKQVENVDCECSACFK